MAPTIRSLATLLALAACAPLPPGPSSDKAEAGPRDSGPEAQGCPRDFLERFDPGPISPGPLRFHALACLGFQSSHFGMSHAILSPDGTAAAHWHDGIPAPIGIVRLDGPGRIDIPNRVTFRNFGSLPEGHGSSPDALAWSSDSRTLWSVRQEVTTPGGFALGGLQPIAIGRDGAVRPLPALRHEAGPLDGLQWVGGEGRALALFGARGGSYRPAHDDPEPTLAMVDAKHGSLLASVRARSLPTLRRRIDANGLRVAGATASLLADGRITSVIQFDRWGERLPGARPRREAVGHPPLWLSWTQGRPPRLWPSPYPDDGFNRLVLVPGGTQLLVIRPLQPHGLQIFCRMPPCPQPPPPTPVAGPIAELLDVSSGKVLWRLRTRVDRFWNQQVLPAVSGDGRYALIELPPDADRLPIALVDMRSGRILQTIAPAHTGSYAYGLGFTADGRRAWVSIGHSMIFFRLGAG